MLSTGSPTVDAMAAFDRANRARRLRALRRRRGRALAVVEPIGAPLTSGRHEIPLDRIRGTVEPFRAAMFDCAFGPKPAARRRWERIWRAGHQRVSVARARGAVAIDAEIDGTL